MNGIKVTLSTAGKQLAYPKNGDVKHVRPSLMDRIDLFALQFPGETAFYSLVTGIVVTSLANWLLR